MILDVSDAGAGSSLFTFGGSTVLRDRLSLDDEDNSVDFDNIVGRGLDFFIPPDQQGSVADFVALFATFTADETSYDIRSLGFDDRVGSDVNGTLGDRLLVALEPLGQNTSRIPNFIFNSGTTVSWSGSGTLAIDFSQFRSGTYVGGAQNVAVTLNIAEAPAPATLALIAFGLLGLFLRRRRPPPVRIEVVRPLLHSKVA